MPQSKNRRVSTKKLTEDEYKRPKETITDMFQTSVEIRKKLDGYGRVESIESVPIGTHIRYITWKDGKERFTLGGKLRKVDHRYVVLYTETFSWCVQRKHFDSKNKLLFETIFFKKLTENDVCKIALMKQQEEIQKLRAENARLKRRNR